MCSLHSDEKALHVMKQLVQTDVHAMKQLVHDRSVQEIQNTKVQKEGGSKPPV